jgi:hypothetical protein
MEVYPTVRRRTEEADSAIERARAFLPDLALDSRLAARTRRSIKCVVLPCTGQGGKPLVLKALHDHAPIWNFYMRREALLYEGFAARPPPLAPCRVPKLIAAGPDFLLLESLPGRPLASRRHGATRRASPAAWDQLLQAWLGLRAWTAAQIPMLEPTAEVRAAMRRRLLEDPCAPAAWIVEGLTRARALGIVTAEAAVRASRALEESSPTVVFGHGDLLLRNVLWDEAQGLGLVDWECGGSYVDGWDAALLWIVGPAEVRRRIEDEYVREGPTKERIFQTCVVFALARELAFRAHRRRDAVTLRLSNELASAVAGLRAR